jgi:hypothetical protein
MRALPAAVSPKIYGSCVRGLLEPDAPTIVAAATEKQQYDDYDQKCPRVHDALLWSRGRSRVGFILSLGTAKRQSPTRRRPSDRHRQHNDGPIAHSPAHAPCKIREPHSIQNACARCSKSVPSRFQNSCGCCPPSVIWNSDEASVTSLPKSMGFELRLF